ncbi:LacI family transcriptional regulator [Microbacterium mangrovi]|uniref:LacI family transcriptional regulator n=2 Tax=Microbacterium mangrovi TaxID=1348253 RepID=A0A0B2A6U5_9MICO|nr:LacI family DNA-binding transcriptional regulator [Microbacterium mangrovi]KHK98785.1 LacI family transcriptional regulator [Microbacterium mangrovi]
MRDVADAAGVSVGTVSNVLNRPHSVSPSTRTRVQGAIDRLGFVRNDAARRLREGQSRTIGLVVPNLRNPFFADVAKGAEERAHKAGLSILIASSDDRPSQEAARLAQFREQRVRGIVIAPVGSDPIGAASASTESGPFVLVGGDHANPTCDSVGFDDRHGGRIAAEHLLKLGRRRLLFIGCPPGVKQVADRLEGGNDAVADRPDAVLEVMATGSMTIEGGRRAATEILERAPHSRPDAIIAANDLVALGVLQALLQADQVRVPHDIALIGYDDIDFAASAAVPLSSIAQSGQLLGSTAVDMMLEGGPASAPRQHVVYRPGLVVRSSTDG